MAQRSISDEKMRVCLICDKNLSDEKEFLSHMVIAHKIKSPSDYEKLVEKKTKFLELVKKVNNKELSANEYKNQVAALER